ncbi:hypothetical protein GCM10019060_27790 [Novosphingobium pokkalii]|nr:hypothetical protein GCM10019060_27790 [Novosphingobium pokkalii]
MLHRQDRMQATRYRAIVIAAGALCGRGGHDAWIMLHSGHEPPFGSRWGRTGGKGAGALGLRWEGSEGSGGFSHARARLNRLSCGNVREAEACLVCGPAGAQDHPLVVAFLQGVTA